MDENKIITSEWSIQIYRTFRRLSLTGDPSPRGKIWHLIRLEEKKKGWAMKNDGGVQSKVTKGFWALEDGHEAPGESSSSCTYLSYIEELF